VNDKQEYVTDVGRAGQKLIDFIQKKLDHFRLETGRERG
jgi:hypothetical protein